MHEEAKERLLATIALLAVGVSSVEGEGRKLEIHLLPSKVLGKDEEVPDS